MSVLLNAVMDLSQSLSLLIELQILVVPGLYWLLRLIDRIAHAPPLRHLVAAVVNLAPVSTALASVLDGLCLELQGSDEAAE